MKKKLCIFILALVCTIVLCACGCEHEWMDATCTDPPTCSKCEATEGEALGHVWFAATCTDPKTCETCGTTEGEAKGHNWLEATCTDPKKCEQCNLTEGEALGHAWQDATTEAPKTCSTCSLTEGERIITDERFKTAAVSDLLGKWVCQIDATGEEIDLPSYEGTIPILYYLNFGNAGDMEFYVELEDEEGFKEVLVQVSIEETYAECAAEGIGKEELDDMITETYGMDMETYIRTALDQIDIGELISSMFSIIDIDFVYYVENDQLYISSGWDLPMEGSTFTIDGDTLTIDSMSEEMGMEMVFTRVDE